MPREVAVGRAETMTEVASGERLDHGLAHSLGRRLWLDVRGAVRLVADAPAAVWLAIVTLASAALLIEHVRGAPAPWIFADELIFWEQARSLAETGELAIRDVPQSGYGFLYPLIASVAFRVSDSLPEAYGLVKGVNAVVMSLAAIPAYFLARQVVSRGFAIGAAALAVAIPSMAYSSSIATEATFYPAFLLAGLAILRAVERPTAARQLTALGAIGLATLVRSQGIVLVPALLTAIALTSFAPRRTPPRVPPLSRVRRYRLTFGVLGVAVATAVSVPLLAGTSPLVLLGAYRESVGEVALSETPVWFVRNLADLDLYTGVIPFVAFVILFGLAIRGRCEERLQRFMLVAASVVLWVTLLVAIFASQPLGQRILERNLFYVVPYLFIALFAWVQAGMPRPARLTIAAATATAALILALPVAALAAGPRRLEVLALLPWWNALLDTDVLPVALPIACAGFCAVAVLVPRRLAAVPIALVAVQVVMAGAAAKVNTASAAESARDGSLGARADWIDAAVGPDAEVTVLWVQPGSTTRERWGHYLIDRRRAVWQSEFFNRSVGDVVYIGNRLPFNLPDREVYVRSGQVTEANGGPVRAAFVLAHRSSRVAGRQIALDAESGLLLTRVEGPIRLEAKGRRAT